MTWALVVPVKRLATAKSRLDGIAASDRQDLALAFALDTVTAALAADQVDRIVVVTDDDRAATALQALSDTVSIEPDLPDAGLNPALVHGAEVATRRHPGLSVGALSSDLPALLPDALDEALAAAAAFTSSLVSDRGGLGTTLLMARSTADFAPRFGPRSRAAHRAAGVVELDLGPSITTLRSDVDTEVDLWEARRLGVGTHTAAVLARL